MSDSAAHHMCGGKPPNIESPKAENNIENVINVTNMNTKVSFC